MTLPLFTRAFATLLIIALVAPSALLIAPDSAHAVPGAGDTVHVITDTSPTSFSILSETTITAIKESASYLLQITETAAEYAQYIKAYILDPLAFIMGGNLLKSITSSILGFVNKNKLYVQNLPGYLQNVGDVKAYAFLNQFSSNSNSPFASTITSSLRANYLQQTSMAGFFAANRNTLSKSSPNYKSFLAGNWSAGGASAWFALTTQDQNNPYLLYYRAQDQMTRSVQNMTAAKLTQLNWGRGFLSWCGSGVNTTSSSGADDEGGYGCRDLDEDGVCRDTDTIDGEGNDNFCPYGTVRAGSVCGRETTDSTPGYYTLPNGYQCSPGTTFSGDYGACEADGVFSVPNDASGDPAYPPGDGATGNTGGTISGTGSGTGTTGTAGGQALLDHLKQQQQAGRGDMFDWNKHKDWNGAQSDTGMCWQWVRMANGLPIGDSSVVLPNAGYTQVSGGISASQDGDIIQVYNPANGKRHVEMKVGSQYVSDFIQKGSNPYSSASPGAVTYTVWRAPARISLAPQSPTKVAVVTLPASKTVKNSSVVGNALGYVWNLAPTATAACTDIDMAGNCISSSGTVVPGSTPIPLDSGGTGSSFAKIPQPGDPCTRPDGTQGKIETPGSVIKDFLSDVLGLNAKKMTMIGDIGASISGIMSNISTVMQTVDMAAGLFGASGGLGSVGGTSSYTSPFNSYLNSSTYMGLSTSDIRNTGAVPNNVGFAAAIDSGNTDVLSMVEISPGAGTSVRPGDTITYRVNIAPINGNQTNFTITDTIPTYTTLSILGGGTDTNSENAVGATGQIWWRQNAPPDKWSGYVQFSVIVDANAPANAQICNTAQISSDQVASFNTSQVCNTVSSVPVTTTDTSGPTARATVPIYNVDSIPAEGFMDYYIPITIGNTVVDANLDSGSTGLQVFKSALSSSDYTLTSQPTSATFVTGDTYSGHIANAIVGLGGIVTDEAIQIQLIESTSCAAGFPLCVKPDDAFFTNDIGKKIFARIGTRMTQYAVEDNPMVKLGGRWTIQLPLPDQTTAGTLTLNPTTDETRGYSLLNLARDTLAATNGFFGWSDHKLPGCLDNLDTGVTSCYNTMLDTGNISNVIFKDAAKTTIAEGTSMKFSITGTPVSFNFTIGDTPGDAVRINSLEELNNSITMGPLPLLYYTVLYDFNKGTMGFLARR